MPNDEYRQMLVNQECESSHLLDNSITLISTGALVLSISFLKDFVGSTYLVKAAWICLLISIGMQLFSYWASERAFKRQIELYDNNEHETILNKWDRAVKLLNIGLRCIGIVWGWRPRSPAPH